MGLLYSLLILKSNYTICYFTSDYSLKLQIPQFTT